MSSKIDHFLSWFDRLFLAVAQIAVAVMMIAVSVDALGRYLFDQPLQGAYEFVMLYLMVMLAFLGMPAIYAEGGHLRIDAFVPLLARVPGQIPERLNALFGVLVFGAASWVAGEVAIDKFVSRDATFGVISFPLYLSYCWVPLGFLLLTLRLLLHVACPPLRERAR